MTVRPLTPRGFVLADVLMGTVLVTALGGVLATSAVYTHRAAAHTAHARAATAAAEAALASLATGRPAPPDVRIEPLAGRSPVAGHHWARVTAADHGHPVTLIGLVPGDR